MADKRPTNLGQGELSMMALEYGIMTLTIARLVSEYKKQLIEYVGRCQNYINEERTSRDPEDVQAIYWSAELIEAARQLELSDAELMEFIKPDPPHRLVKVKVEPRHEHVEACFTVGESWETALNCGYSL